jgi:hypothetical protein
MRAIDATAGLRRLSGPIAVVLALAVSITTCRLDKLIKPAIADRLTVSEDSLRDSANVGSTLAREITVLVASADGVTLPWTATKTAAWVTLEPPSGSAPDTLLVKLHPDTLSQTLHRDTIVFTSTQSNVTVRVPVAFDMLPPAAELRLSDTARADTAFLGSAQPDTFSLRIRNTGSLPLDWTAVFNATWVTLSDSGGTVPPHDSTLTLVTLRPESLNTGLHSGRIIFTASGAIGSPDTLPITYTIQPCVETLVPTLDTMVTSSIALSDCGAPQRPGRHAKLYAVQATAGDTLSLRLTSAAFNAFLILTNSSGATVLDSTDACGAVGTACIINFPVTATARYVLEATTRDSGETGAFTMSAVRERAPSAPQAAGQFRKDSTVAIGVGAVTPQDTVVFKATLNDPNPSDSVRLEIEVAPVGSAFSNSASHQGNFVAVAPGGRVVAVRAPALSENTGYHWQARTCDKTNRCSAWVSFGQNAETAPDFYVNATPEDPPVPASIGQFTAGGAPIAVGGNSGGGNVVLSGTVNDPDPGDQVRLEVEVRQVGSAFSNVMTAASTFGSLNRVASATVGATLLLSYHWQVRTCDQMGRCSAWVTFPQPTPNPESSADFVGSL